MSCQQHGGTNPEKKVSAILSSKISASEPGAAVLVIKNGQAVLKRGYGVADIRVGNSISARTNFRLASLTKQFTAAAVMLMVREGQLRYEQTLTDIFPDFPDYGQTITIRHLLTHTSGLPDYENLMTHEDPDKSLEEQQINDYQVLELLKKEKSGKFAPGTEWDYSNSGYVVLGLIVEKVSGLPFGHFLEERIFKPLGMDGTVLYERGLNQVPERAFGHSRKDGVWVIKDQSLTSATRGDGGIYSSLEDLLKWEKSLEDRSLLTEQEMELANTPVVVSGKGPVEPDGQPAAYGFGWFLNPWKGHRRAWHYGETAGFRTAIHRLIDWGLTVIVLCNRDDIDASDLAIRIAEVYLDQEKETGGY
ncbi:MAG: serine hydrolase domain-containing protein [Candidatus Saccharicenans sp.]